MKKVIIVDDEPVVRMDLREMVEELGFLAAGEAEDGFDAIELCRRTKPDVVLMDVKMPVFDGLSASAAILEEGLSDCVILLTAYSDREIVEKAVRAGVSGYLVKPVSKAALEPALEVALAQSQALKESRERALTAEKKLEEDRVIHKAQAVLAGKEGISEAEAYRRMRSLAMNKRVSVFSLASGILKQNRRESDLDFVKSWLMKEKRMSEEKAYRYIVNYGKRYDCSTEEAAAKLREALPERLPGEAGTLC